MFVQKEFSAIFELEAWNLFKDFENYGGLLQIQACHI